MKAYKPFMLGVFVTLLALSMFWVGNVFAATDCFSDIATLPTVFQEAICWMKDNGVTSGYPDGTYKPNGTVTRAQMALFMKNQAEVPPSTGDIYVNTGPSDWVVNHVYAGSGIVQPYYGWTHLESSSTGTILFQLSPTLPSGLYGKMMVVKGIKLCYDASVAGAFITALEIKHIYYDTSGMHTWGSINDPTDLTNVGCRTVYFDSPRMFFGNDQVTINLYANYTSTASEVKVGSTTVILAPSANPAVLESLDLERPADTPSIDDPAAGGEE